MAADLAAKKILLAQNLVAQARVLVDTYYAIKKLNGQYVKGGISYAAGDFDGSPIRNVDPLDMAPLITRLTDFVSWYETGAGNAAGTLNADILLKVQDGSR